MIFEGQQYLGSDPWLAILPGLVMFLAVAGTQFLSQQFTAESRGSLLRKGGM
jgi:peptide/nickel transport system permease protein